MGDIVYTNTLYNNIADIKDSNKQEIINKIIEILNKPRDNK